MNRLQIALKTALQLGLQKTALYAIYQLALKSGFMQWLTPCKPGPQKKAWLQPTPNLPLLIPEASILINIQADQTATLLEEAQSIVQRHFIRFGAHPPVPVDLSPSCSNTHWSHTQDQPAEDQDIKFIWEPARFGWVFPLARAYVLHKEDSFAGAFWELFETFQRSNPVNCGPNWASGQEVALRILAFAFALQVFSDAPSSTPERRQNLLSAIAAHARRIPPTLLYARAQNNNHLVTEAVGLYTAGCLLPGHPQAPRWRKLGWRWFNHAILNQISGDGTYVQQSTNYHRLMLQAALWLDALARRMQQPLPENVMHRLALATQWLYAMSDPVSGKVPNLGHNDGAHILPLAAGNFADYRPTLQAAGCAFLGAPLLPPGPWDETALWLGLQPDAVARQKPQSSPAVHRLNNGDSWAVLRAVCFHDRPAQADQLHVDIWWHGINIAQDPGTFRYTARPPWNNGLARTGVHNTLTIDGQDQMIRAGRFLWLDWAQARLLDQTPESISAEHTGYQRAGMTHQRTLSALPAQGWQITDVVLPAETQRPALSQTHEICLHWLLPDLPWHIDHQKVFFITATGKISLEINATHEYGRPLPIDLQLVRAGKVIFGKDEDLPTLGWSSPTYGSKEAALSVRAMVLSTLPLRLVSLWDLPLDRFNSRRKR